ncbi:MAG: PPC domain-containing protein [Myxococcota bacterium]
MTRVLAFSVVQLVAAGSFVAGCTTGETTSEEDAGGDEFGTRRGDGGFVTNRRDAGDGSSGSTSSSSSGGSSSGESPDGGRPRRDGGAGSTSSTSGGGSTSSTSGGTSTSSTSGGGSTSSSSGGASTSSGGNTCQNDALEPNNLPAEATPVAAGTYNATLCREDLDIFRVNLATGQEATATITFDNARGNLSLFLYAPDGQVAQSSETTNDTETVTHTAATAGAYYVVVRGAATDQSNTFQLRIQLGTPPVNNCSDDAYEQNDSTASASAVGAGNVTARICNGDPDFFRVDLNTGDRLDVSMTYTQSSGDLDLEVLNAAGTSVGSSANSTGTESISHTAAASGSYYIRAFGRGAAEGSYTLNVSITPATGGCQDDGYEQNDSAQAAQSVAAGTLNATICSGDDDYFALNANAGDQVSVVVRLANGAPNLDVEVRGPSGTVVASGTQPGGDTVTVTVAASGRHVLRVFAPSSVPSAVAYELEVSITPANTGCTDDPFEDNDTQGTARSLATGNHAAQICVGDDDYFKLSLNTGDALSATITFDSAVADLDLYILGPDGTVLDGSEFGENQEQVTWTAASAGEYAVRVAGYLDAEAPYQMTLTVTPATTTCHEDAFEDNDTAAAARAVQPGALSAQICSGDDDFFGVALNLGDALTVTATFDGASGDLDLRLIAPDGRNLDQSSGVTDTESVSFTADMAGTYVVQVLGYNGDENAYDLDVAVVPAAPTCTDDAFEENDTQATASAVGPGTFTGQVCSGDSDYFKVVLNAQDTLKVDLTFTDAEGDLDLRVLDASGAQVASSTGVTDLESITYQAPTAGTYTIRVHGFQTAENDYSLQVRVDPFIPPCGDDAQEDNDSSAAPRAINAGTTGNLRICPSDDDWFSINVVAGDTVQVNLTTSTAGQNLDLQLTNSTGTVLASSAGAGGNESATTTASASGVILVRVFGTAADASYSLAVTVTPAAPTCTDDAREPNDTSAAAVLVTPGTITGLQICARDDDFFAVDVPAGGSLTASISFTHAEGDLDLALLDSAGNTITSSTGTTGTETVSYTATTAVRVLIRAYGFLSAENDYSLTVTVTGGTPGCTDDAFEDNDTSAAATAVTPGSRNGQVCSGDDDYYRITLGAGETIQVDVLFTDADGDLDLRLRDSNQAVVASSTSTNDDENLTYTAATGGTFYIQVYGWQGAANDYVMNITVTQPAGCTDDNQEPNNGSAAARALPTSPASLKICPGDDDWFTVSLVAGETFSVSAAFTHANGDLDLRLYDTDGTTVLASSVTSNNTESINVQAPVAMTALVRINGVSGAQNSYTLTWSRSLPTITCPADDSFEVNDDRQGSTVLERGTTMVGRLCANDEDWFAVALETGDDLLVVMSPNDGNGDLDLELLSPQGQLLASSSETGATAEAIQHTAATPGVYFVVVSGYQSAENRYAIYTDIVPAAGACQDDTVEPNNTLAQARDDGVDGPTNLDQRPTTAGQLCLNEEDWFDLAVFNGERVVVDLKYDHSLGDLDVYLLRDNGTAGGQQVASSLGSSGSEHMEFTTDRDEILYVRIKGYNSGFGPYTLMWTIQ